MSQPFVIRTENLTRRYNDVVAVDGLDLQVAPGKIYGFLGPNGAGKTTTIRMLLGLIRPTTGRVWLFDHRLDEHRRMLLQRVGALVETPSLYGHLTGRENLEVTRRLTGGARMDVDRVLAIVHLAKDAGRRVSRYSLGMKQRLGLALALMNRPGLLILDEPTNGLDPAGIQETRDLIRDLPGQQGTTVLLSSHLLSEVEQVADEVGILNHGRLLFQGTVEALHEKRTPHLILGVEPFEDARILLEKTGWPLQTDPTARRLIVEATGPADTARINRLLVGHHIDVHHLCLEKPSLENTFLALTQSP